MKALLLILVLMPFSFAQAKQVAGDDLPDFELGNLSYLQVLPGLKNKVRGADGDKLIEGLNQAFRELNQDGKSDPSFADVARRLKADGGLPDGQHAELITLCVISIVGGLAAGGAYVLSDRKLSRLVRSYSGSGPGCSKDKAELLDSAKGRSRTAVAPAGASST